MMSAGLSIQPRRCNSAGETKMRCYRGVLWIVCASCLLAVRPAAAQEAQPSAGAPETRSPFALQQEYSRLSQEVGALGQQIAAAQQVSKDLLTVRHDVEEVPYDGTAANDALTSIQGRREDHEKQPMAAEVFKADKGRLLEILDRPRRPLRSFVV